METAIPLRQQLIQALRRPLIQYLLLFLAVLCVYLPTLWYTYVWDDSGLITGNESIRAWRNMPSFFSDPRTFGKDPGVPHALAWRPVRNIYYLLTYKVHNLRPAGWHLHHVLIHSLAASMLLAMFYRLIRYTYQCKKAAEIPIHFQAAAWCAVLAWAVHPANLEVTAWLKSADDILSSIFVLACLMALFPTKKPLTFGRAIAASILFALALLSKESVTPLPLIYVALLVVLSPNLKCTLRHKPTLLSMNLLFATAAVYLMIRTALLGKLEQVPYLAGSFSLMMATMTTAIVRYLQLTFWPFWPTMQIGDYMGWPMAASWAELRVLYSTAIIVVVAIVISLISRHNRLFLAGWLFAIAAFAPVANIVPMMQVMAERFMYFPLMGIALAIAALYSAWLTPNLSKRLWIPIVITLALGSTTLYRMPMWIDDTNFQAQNLKALPANYRANHNLGVVEYKAGNKLAAATHFAKSMQLKPNVKTGLLAVHSLIDLNQTTSALNFLDNMIRDFPESPRAFALKADILRVSGDTTNALVLYNEVIKRVPDEPEFFYLRAELHQELGGTTKALSDLDQALKLDPSLTSATTLKATLLTKKN